MTYNLIGDIHGRNAWRQLVRTDMINIFLGDYLDPYDRDDLQASPEEYDNLQDIIRFKQQHPETILLLGNHDLHYLWDEHYSRYNDEHAERYAQLIREHLHLFQAAYAIGDRVLVTHAGVTRPWLQLAGISHQQSASQLAEAICRCMSDEESRHLFSGESTFHPDDSCGMSPTASPIWVRPHTLLDYGALTNHHGDTIYQVVGHTQISQIMQFDSCVFVDCLGSVPQSLRITFDAAGEPIFTPLPAKIQ
jgi:hypothetical protein